MPNPLYIVGTSIAAIRSAAASGGSIPDGQPAVLRLGSGTDTTDIPLVYNMALDKFVGPEFCAVRSTDQVPFGLASSFTTKQYLGLSPSNGSYWGVTGMRKVGSALSAGLKLQYRHHGFLQKDSSGQMANVGCVFYHFNSGDPSPPAQGYNTPPAQSDLVAETAYLHGGVANPGFAWTESGWADLLGPAATGTYAPTGSPSITKDFVYPRVHMGMDAGATASGKVVDYALFLRYVG